jgi:hypothetical protein
MVDSLLEQLFEKVRNQPYALNTKPDDTALNCVVKNTQLAGELALHGYLVRGFVGEFDWSATPLPATLAALAPAQFPATHYWLEVDTPTGWQRLDASADDRLVRAGWPLCTSTNQALMVSIQKVYNSQEHQEYMLSWQDQTRVTNYYALSEAFLNQAQVYFASLK